jgi:uncharacterized flavoprotein (TIGR03862 family)
MKKNIAIVGGGPSGLAAAEILSARGHDVHVFDAMPSFGRKLLLAGKTGLNITHTEDYEAFASRYGGSADPLRHGLDAFKPENVIAWANGLEAACFTGSSGRIFPKAMKASPLLRAWLGRLNAQGVTFHPRHHWQGFAENGLRFATPEGDITQAFDATLLALGGASWPRLGSDGEWVQTLTQSGVTVAPLRPANCGFDVNWSVTFWERFEGAPVKAVAATSKAGTSQGEFVISSHGVEGSLIYAHSAALRDALEETGLATLNLDLAPGRSEERLAADLARQPAKLSFSNRIRKGTGLDGVKAALLRECAPDISHASPQAIARRIKSTPIKLVRPRPIAEAISSAGGITWDAVDQNYMLNALPGIFVAGEMIDWEAPTGGYLLTACLATGRAAAQGMDAWLTRS